MSNDWQLKHQEKAVDLSKEALRTIVLLNGAAVIALFALIGQIIKDAPGLVLGVLWAVQVFVLGAVLGGLATFVGYVTQYLIAESATKGHLVFWSKLVHWIAILSVVAAYVAFIVAAFAAAGAVRVGELPTIETAVAPPMQQVLPQPTETGLFSRTLRDPTAIATWALVLVGAVAAAFALRHVQTLKKFELLKYIESSEVRDARRKVYQEIAIGPRQGQEWWKDKANDDLEKAAALVCASYDILGLVAGRLCLGRFFARSWAHSIVWSHEALKPYLDYRRENASNAYHTYTQLYDRARAYAKKP